MKVLGAGSGQYLPQGQYVASQVASKAAATATRQWKEYRLVMFGIDTVLFLRFINPEEVSLIL